MSDFGQTVQAHGTRIVRTRTRPNRADRAIRAPSARVPCAGSDPEKLHLGSDPDRIFRTPDQRRAQNAGSQRWTCARPVGLVDQDDRSHRRHRNGLVRARTSRTRTACRRSGRPRDRRQVDCRRPPASSKMSCTRSQSGPWKSAAPRPPPISRRARAASASGGTSRASRQSSRCAGNSACGHSSSAAISTTSNRQSRHPGP